jgi:hypothetical protein
MTSSRSDSGPTDVAFEEVAERVRALSDDTFAALDRLDGEARETLDLTSGAVLDDFASWAPLQPVVADLLAGHDQLTGCGLAVAGRDSAAASRPSMAWWVRTQDGIAPKRHVFNPRADSFYDVRQSPWFALPVRSGRRVLLGPYVDSWGTDDLTMTACSPVLIGADVVAVVAADLDAHAYVTEVETLLEALGTPVALVDTEERVIAARRHQVETGVRLAAAVPPGEREVVALIPSLGWKVVALG